MDKEMAKETLHICVYNIVNTGVISDIKCHVLFFTKRHISDIFTSFNLLKLNLNEYFIVWVNQNVFYTFYS